MERIFVGCAKKCGCACAYCFSDWDNGRERVLELPGEITADTILYPSCDGELEDITDFDGLIALAASNDKHRLVISVSTKKNISSLVMDKLKALDAVLRKKGAGFVKAAVSVTTKYSARQIEPMAASYQERLDTMEEIVAAGLAGAVTIKPVLPFVPTEEYREIADDYLRHTKYFLLGDLYVDVDTAFYKEYIKGQYGIKTRRVGWLKGQNEWFVVESERVRSRLAEYIAQRGALPFESDRELVEGMLP